MSFKFLKISSYYRDFLKDYYTRFPEVKILDYEGQHTQLMCQYFAWSDNYGRLLAHKGIETMEIVANAMPMQKIWAKENGFSSDLSPEEIVCRQIEHFKPNVIYFQDSITFNSAFINRLKSQHPFIRLIIGNICSPFTSSQIEDFKSFDYLTVCSPQFREILSKYGIKCVLIPHAFDKRILEKINIDNYYPESDLLFTGSIIPDEGFHNIRLQILENLVNNNILFDFYGNLPDISLLGLFKRQASYSTAHILDKIGLGNITDSVPLIRKGRGHKTMPKQIHISKELQKIVKPPLFGMEMFKALSKAKIGFNNHGDCAGDYVANMRMFETTGVGSCLLTDMKKDLHHYFNIDYEVVAYSSADECIEKVKWLINHPQQCREIALKGQQRTIKEHNFESRIEIFYDFLKRSLN